MSNITEFYEKLQSCYESLFEFRLQRKTASSEEQKKDVLKIFKEERQLKKTIREMRIAIAAAIHNNKNNVLVEKKEEK